MAVYVNEYGADDISDKGMTKRKYELSQQERYNAEADDAISNAQARFERNRAHFARISPGSVSPQERASWDQYRAEGRQDKLMNHEMEMLKTKGTNDLEVERAKAEGLKNQGSEAARFAAEASKYGADKTLEGVEKKGLSDQEVARIQGKSALDLADKTNAGNLAVAQEQGKTQLGVAQTQGKNAVEAEIVKGRYAAEAARSGADAAIAAGERKHQYDMQLQALKNQGRQLSQTEYRQVQALMSKNKLTYDQAMAQVMAQRGVGAAQ